MSQFMVGLWPHVWLTVIGFLIFLTFFIGVMAWIFQGSNKDYFEEASRLPLDTKEYAP